jgi:NitT/TauT family transport system permease protein
LHNQNRHDSVNSKGAIAMNPSAESAHDSIVLPQSEMLPPTVFWRISENIPRQLALILVTLSIAVPLILWWVVSTWLSAGGGAVSVFLPTPVQVWGAFQTLLSDGTLQKDIVFSLFRVLSGFFLAAIVSIPLGMLMGAFASVRSLLEPVIGIVRYMPAPAFIPLLILYFGLGEIPKILLIFIGTLFFNTLMIMDAVKFVPKELIETTYTLGGKRLQVLLQVIFPYIYPSIIDACRVNMAASWNLVIVAELVAATEGLGKRISIAQRFLRTDEIFVGLIVIGLIGLTIDLLFRLWLRLACRWAR